MLEARALVLQGVWSPRQGSMPRDPMLNRSLPPEVNVFFLYSASVESPGPGPLEMSSRLGQKQHARGGPGLSSNIRRCRGRLLGRRRGLLDLLGLLGSGRHSQGQLLPRQRFCLCHRRSRHSIPASCRHMVSLSSNHASDLMGRRLSRSHHLIPNQASASQAEGTESDGSSAGAPVWAAMPGQAAGEHMRPVVPRQGQSCTSCRPRPTRPALVL